MVDVPSVELFFYWWFAVMFFGIGVTSVLNSQSSMGSRYAAFRKPSWAPTAGWIFGVVWFVLYLLQSIAAWNIRLLGAWESGVNMVALILFAALQIALTLYTVLFAASLWGASASVFVSLLLAIVVTVFFWRLSLLSGLVMLPLLLWLTYALVLSVYLSVNNSDSLAVRTAQSQATHNGRMPPRNRSRTAIQRQAAGRRPPSRGDRSMV